MNGARARQLVRTAFPRARKSIPDHRSMRLILWCWSSRASMESSSRLDLPLLRIFGSSSVVSVPPGCHRAASLAEREEQ